jgi:hypothetical protein
VVGEVRFAEWTRDGRLRHTLYYKATFRGPDGSVAGLIGTIIDITARVQSEQRQAIEHSVGQLLGHAETVAEAITGIIEEMCRRFGWACGARWSLDERENRLHCVESWSEDDPALERFLSTSSTSTFVPGHAGIIRRTLKTGVPGKELKLVLKADAQGSIEAIKDAVGKINSPEVKIVLIHEGVGNINYSDVILALASDALILGFNVVADDQAKALIDKEGQDIRTYNVIYEIVNDIRAALEGMLAPKLKKLFVGRAEVRKVFKLSTSGMVAGSYVTKGKIARNAHISVLRNGQVVHEGELSSLKRFKDDVREVEEGFECGIQVKGFPEVMEGDLIEAYQIQKIARTLE